jgi:glycosyltransferase involved in cell wall biosynthesis
MNLAFILPSLRAVGPNIFTLALIRAWLEAYPGTRITVFHCKPDTGLEFPCETRPIATLTREEGARFDGVFSTMLRADAWLAFVGRGIPRERRVSVIHNFIDEDLRFLYAGHPVRVRVAEWLWRRSLNRIRHLITSSPFMERRYREMLSSRNDLVTIPYGVPDPTKATGSVHPARDGRRNGPFVLTACGNLIARKNFGLIVQALQSLPDCRLRLIGDGPERVPLEALAGQLGVADRVEFLGVRFDLAAQLMACDCYVMPSFSEGYGLAMLEAIALGMPVVCADLPIYEDMMPGDAVPRFPPTSVPGLVDAVRRVQADPARYARATRDIFETRHTDRQMAEHYHDYVRQRLAPSAA